MKLPDVVKALMCGENINVSDDDIVETVRFLISDSVCHKPKVLFRIGKMVADTVEYEKEPIG